MTKPSNKKQKILNAEQTALVTELSENYGIDPEQIIFFENEAKPFLTYEATANLINHLKTDIIDINVDPVQSTFPDSVSVKCTIVFKNENKRSSVGVANLAEKIDESAEISEQQAMNLASSRALRNVLRVAGIDLMRLHNQSMNREVLDFKHKSNKNLLLAEVHQLGTEAGLINGDNKSAWYALLNSRYNVASSNELDEVGLSDFAAVLKTFAPANRKIAA